MTKRKLIIGVAAALLAAVSLVGCSKMTKKEKELRAQADVMEKGLELAFEQVDEAMAPLLGEFADIDYSFTDIVSDMLKDVKKYKIKAKDFRAGVDEVDAYTQTWYDKLEERYDTQWEIIDDRYYDSDDDSAEFKAQHDIAKEYIYQMWDISEDMLDAWYSILLERVDQLEPSE